MRAHNKFMLVLSFTACTLAILAWSNLNAAPIPEDFKPENNCNPHTCWQTKDYNGYESFSTNPSTLWEFGFLTAGNPDPTWNPTQLPFGTEEPNGVALYDKPNDAAKKNKLVRDANLGFTIRKWSDGDSRCKDTTNKAILRTPATFFKTLVTPEIREDWPTFKCVDR